MEDQPVMDLQLLHQQVIDQPVINLPPTTRRPTVSIELEDDEFPQSLFNIMHFNGWKFKDYFYCPQDKMVYRLRFCYNTDDKEYPPVRLCINKNNNQIDMYDIQGIRHSININSIRKIMKQRLDL